MNYAPMSMRLTLNARSFRPTDISLCWPQADDKAKVVAVNHAPTSVRLTLKLGSLTGRAAFSHVPFLHSILWMIQAILLAPTNVEPPQTPMAIEVCISFAGSVGS